MTKIVWRYVRRKKLLEPRLGGWKGFEESRSDGEKAGELSKGLEGCERSLREPWQVLSRRGQQVGSRWDRATLGQEPSEEAIGQE